jgi:hypothetical protein
VLLLRLLSPILALLALLLLQLRLLPQLLSPAGHKLLNLLFLKLLLILLRRLGRLQLLRLRLPLNHLLRDDVYRLRVVNPRRDVVLQLRRITLPIQVGVEKHSEISAWWHSYSSFSF